MTEFNGSNGLRNFLAFIEETLIPDTKEAQRFETAKDLQKLVNIARTKQERNLELLSKVARLERQLENSKKALKKYYDVHSQLNDLVHKMQGF